MRSAPIWALCFSALVCGSCGGDDDGVSTTVSSAAAGSAGPSAAKPELTTAKAVADALAAAGLGCTEREPQAPEPPPDFPVPSETMLCIVSSREIGITVYAKEGDPERYRIAASKVFCKELSKADAEKRTAAYGRYFFVGTADGDPVLAATFAQATGGEVKNFNCS